VIFGKVRVELYSGTTVGSPHSRGGGDPPLPPLRMYTRRFSRDKSVTAARCFFYTHCTHHWLMMKRKDSVRTELRLVKNASAREQFTQHKTGIPTVVDNNISHFKKDSGLFQTNKSLIIGVSPCCRLTAVPVSSLNFLTILRENRMPLRRLIALGSSRRLIWISSLTFQVIASSAIAYLTFWFVKCLRGMKRF
jgi:hypothetical protein